ncbi:MAG: peptide deformylase [Chloroflexi bacterium]|nr:MAG: peptide deformylase [Chloroflexota bacterium]MBL1195658.1 peptide deformylase [Chloroflexota bacterium]NOH12946.1 peptide deformylase [Chloroflexota bacterium]
MAVRQIVYLPDKVLRRKARPIKDFGPDLQTLIDDMVETMRDAPGVGLAAPQVGVSQRVIVIEYGEETEEGEEPSPPKLYTIVNPEVARRSEETEMGVEGCLSIPGLVGDVERAVSVTVKGQSRQGQAMKIKAEGWLARILQHEIDHLDGVLYPDIAEQVYQPVPEEEDEYVDEANV